MSTRTGTGILQVAFGRQYVKEATAAALSAKAVMPDVPIALVTDAPTRDAEKIFDQVITLPGERPDIPEKFWGFYNKIHGLQASPFERTLYMDVDIHCIDSVTECFTMLEKKTMVAVPVPPRDRAADSFQTANPLPPMNTGVLGFNFSTLPADFFDAWKQLYLNHCPTSEERNFGDQSIFRILAWEQNIDILLLDYAYNFRMGKPGLFSGPVKLLHGRAPNAAFIGQFLNITTAPRVYLPHNALLVYEAETHDWILYPYHAPEEPSRFSTITLADTLLLAAEENGLDQEAAELALAALRAQEAA